MRENKYTNTEYYGDYSQSFIDSSPKFQTFSQPTPPPTPKGGTGMAVMGIIFGIFFLSFNIPLAIAMILGSLYYFKSSREWIGHNISFLKIKHAPAIMGVLLFSSLVVGISSAADRGSVPDPEVLGASEVREDEELREKYDELKDDYEELEEDYEELKEAEEERLEEEEELAEEEREREEEEQKRKEEEEKAKAEEEEQARQEEEARIAAQEEAVRQEAERVAAEQKAAEEARARQSASNNTINTTPTPAPQPEPEPTPTKNCDPSYPTLCLTPGIPDLNCGDISARRFPVNEPDPHGFDGDNDGIGCES